MGPKTKSFEIVILRFVSNEQAIWKKGCQNRMKNDGVMPIKKLRTKVAVGLFWAKNGYFGHIL